MKKANQPKKTADKPGAELPLSLVHIKEVKPGDIVVLRTPRILSHDHKQAIAAAVQAAGLPVKVLVLEDGMEIDVIRPPVKSKSKKKES